jgi:low affinity Fe/Cu permease
MFRKIATKISNLSGHAAAFFLAIALVMVWGATGPLFGFSNTWQLIINTGTTITTFLMVFLIQNTQNRDTKAIQLKLDELLLSSRGRDAFVDLEDMTDEELAELEREFREVREKLSGSRTMKKLHERLEAERAMRKKRTMLETLNPLTFVKHKDQK